MHFKTKNNYTPLLSECDSGLLFDIMALCLSQVAYVLIAVEEKECLGDTQNYNSGPLL